MAAAGAPSPVAWTRGEKLRTALLYAAIGTTTGVAFALALSVGSQYLLFFGLAVAMYVFGLRHGVDADHIAAIDNTTRKLLQDGKRPLTVGMWFSLGHSTIVVGLIVALIAATETIRASLPGLTSFGAVVGTLISGAFLWILALVNIVIVLGLYRLFRDLRNGRYRPGELETQLAQRGFMNRFFGRLSGVVQEPWQIYPIGVLFGLGFDTASEVALIAITVGFGVSGAVPVGAVFLLPVLFLCGMVLVDTTDGIAMRYAYGWAFQNPLKKIYYNLTVTVISVLVAFVIGAIEVLQVVSGELHLGGTFWGWLNGIDFETLGYVVVALFLGTWVIAMAIFRWKGYGETPGSAGPSEAVPVDRAR